MPDETLAQSIRKTLLYAALLVLLTIFLAAPRFTAAQASKKPTPKLLTGGEATLEADQQRESGKGR